MAFSILEAHPMEAGLCHAVLAHQDQHLAVMLKCGHEEALALPNPFTAEIDHALVVRFEAGLPADDALSGLFATDDSTLILADGTVCRHTGTGPGQVLIDVFIQHGPESFAVTSDEMDGAVPEIGSRLRVWLLGLGVWPVRH